MLRVWASIRGAPGNAIHSPDTIKTLLTALIRVVFDADSACLAARRNPAVSQLTLASIPEERYPARAGDALTPRRDG